MIQLQAPCPQPAVCITVIKLQAPCPQPAVCVRSHDIHHLKASRHPMRLPAVTSHRATLFASMPRPTSEMTPVCSAMYVLVQGCRCNIRWIRWVGKAPARPANFRCNGSTPCHLRGTLTLVLVLALPPMSVSAFLSFMCATVSVLFVCVLNRAPSCFGVDKTKPSLYRGAFGSLRQGGARGCLHPCFGSPQPCIE